MEKDQKTGKASCGFTLFTMTSFGIALYYAYVAYQQERYMHTSLGQQEANQALVDELSEDRNILYNNGPLFAVDGFLITSSFNREEFTTTQTGLLFEGIGSGFSLVVAPNTLFDDTINPKSAYFAKDEYDLVLRITTNDHDLNVSNREAPLYRGKESTGTRVIDIQLTKDGKYAMTKPVHALSQSVGEGQYVHVELVYVMRENK